MTDNTVHRASPIQECLNGLSTLSLFIEATLLGLDQASEATGWIEVNRRLKKLEGTSFSAEDLQILDAKRHAQNLESFARQERSDGHPYLYGISIVRIWTILETLVDDLILLRLSSGRYKVDSEALSNVKLPLREILGTTPEQQAEAVLNELKQTTRSRLQQGVGKFEVLLNAVSLAGNVDEDVRKAIYECSQVRNLIAHQNSVVDSKFLVACPWFTVAENSRLPLSRSLFNYYFSAAFWYAMELQRRIDVLDGPPTNSESLEIQALFLRNVQTFVNP